MKNYTINSPGLNLRFYRLMFALCVLCMAAGLKAQPTATCYKQWAFGANASINYATAPLTMPAMATNEGCAGYCDASGALLFYTDGRAVWNGANLACATALNGSPNTPVGSAAQGVLILPTTTSDEFMIFTVSDAQQNVNGIRTNNGLTYYRYNSTTNAITGGPTQPTFNSYTTEEITAIPHCNGKDFWVIVKPVINPAAGVINLGLAPNNATSDNNALYAYLVSATGGVANAPIVSTFGTNAYQPHLADADNWASVIKASPDRKYMALSESVFLNGSVTGGALNLYRFDCGSGTFEFIHRQGQNFRCYGLSFDESSGYLYTSNNTRICRYDVDSLYIDLDCGGHVTKLDTTSFAITGYTSNVAFYALQLNQQNEIIIAKNMSNTLARFTTPSNLNPGYQYDVTLNPGSCRLGLPNNIDGNVDTIPIPLSCSVCPSSCGNNLCFKAMGCITTGTWSFGDGTTLSGSGYTPITVNNNAGNFLNPCHTFPMPGIYTVTLSVGKASCIQTVAVGVYWEKTTKNTVSGDQGNDVITDAHQNSYVAGTFKLGTTFTFPCGDRAVTNAGGTSAYIAKFDNCGNLLWVNYDSSDVFSTGTGIALDSIRQEVYMTGLGLGSSASMNFQTTALSCAGPASGPVSFPVKQYYVAKFNSNTGSYINEYSSTFINVSATKPGLYVDVRNRTATSTDVFLAGGYVNSTANELCFVQKLSNTTSFLPAWVISSPPGAGGARTVNDIAYHPASGNVLITGSFSTGIQFGSTALTTAANSDAFVFGFSGGNTSAVIGGNNLKVQPGPIPGNIGIGTSLITNGPNIYCTGYFNANVTGVFGSANNFNGGSGNKYRSYVVRFSSSNFSTVSGVQQLMAVTTPGDVMASGIGINVAQTRVVITGQFNASITSPVFSPNGALYTGNSGGNKLFIAAFNPANLSAQWSNASNDNNTASSVHQASKISVRGDFCYTTGNYTRYMGFNAGTPTSGPLSATPAGLTNTFLLRTNMAISGVFARTQAPETTGSSSLSSETELSLLTIYPNPNTGIFSIKLPGGLSNAHLEIINNLGTVLYKKQFVKLEEEQIDISQLPKGIYYIHLGNASGVKEVRKLIKE